MILMCWSFKKSRYIGNFGIAALVLENVIPIYCTDMESNTDIAARNFYNTQLILTGNNSTGNFANENVRCGERNTASRWKTNSKQELSEIKFSYRMDVHLFAISF